MKGTMIKFLKQIGKLKASFHAGQKKVGTGAGEGSDAGKAARHVHKKTGIHHAVPDRVAENVGDSLVDNEKAQDDIFRPFPPETNAGKQASAHHPRPVRRSIDAVFDKETGAVVKADLFFSQPEYLLEAFRKRLDDAIAGSLQPRFICMYCGQMLRLAVRKTGKGKMYFFAHLPGSGACCLKTTKKTGKGNKPEETGYDQTGEFTDGLAVVSKDGKYGVIDRAGTLVVPVEYDEIEKFEAGRAKARRNGRYGYLDENGNMLIAFKYAEIGAFKEGRAKARLAPLIYGKHPNCEEHECGYIDEQGGIVIPFEYDSIGEFKDGQAKVTKGMKNGCIDDRGNLIVPLEYARRNGTVVYFNTSRNFGFITESDTMTTLFFHIDNAFTNVQYSDKVSFIIREAPKGYEALRIWKTTEATDNKTKAWIRINEAFENGEQVEGVITSLKKGGMVVDLGNDVEAFLPCSQIEPIPVADYNAYLGRTLKFRILKINRRIRNVVVSHSAAVEYEFKKERTELLDSLEKGKVLEGTVKKLMPYGAFVHLGCGIDGLIYISDLHWQPVSHPSEVVQPGQKIKVMVLGFNEDKTRISLGLRQIALHPSFGIAGNLKPGDIVAGKIADFSVSGLFVEIMPGAGGPAAAQAEDPKPVPAGGFVHHSEISWSKYSRSPEEIFQIGSIVQTRVTAINRDEGKLTLSIKQTLPDPWLPVNKRFDIGTRHKAYVRVPTGFGLFVELEEGICGMIHISDLSWIRWIRPVDEFAPVGSEIEVMVLDIDHQNRRLILGHKQLTDDPWNRYKKVFTTGSVHQGTVAALTANGADIGFLPGVRGFASLKHIRKEDGTQAGLHETLPFMINKLNRESQQIIVAYAGSRTDETTNTETGNPDETQPNREAAILANVSVGESNYSLQAVKVKARKQPLRKITFGDLEALTNLKAQMQAEEDQNS